MKPSKTFSQRIDNLMDNAEGMKWDLKVMNNMIKCIGEKSNGLKRCFACMGYGHDDTQCPNKGVTKYEEYEELKARSDPWICLICKGYGHKSYECKTQRIVYWNEIDAPKKEESAPIIQEHSLVEEKKEYEEKEAKVVASFNEEIKTGESGKDKSDHADETVCNFHMEDTQQAKLVSLDSQLREQQFSCSEQDLKLNGDASKDEEKKTLSGNLGFNETAPSEENHHISQVIDTHLAKQTGLASQLTGLQSSCLDQDPIPSREESKLPEKTEAEWKPDNADQSDCFDHNFFMRAPNDVIPNPYETRQNSLGFICSGERLNRTIEDSKSTINPTRVESFEQAATVISIHHNSSVLQWNEMNLGLGHNFYKEAWMSPIVFTFEVSYDGSKAAYVRKLSRVSKTRPKVKMKLVVAMCSIKALLLREAHIHGGMFLIKYSLIILPELRTILFQEGEYDAGACQPNETYAEYSDHNSHMRSPNEIKPNGLDSQLILVQLLCTRQDLNRTRSGSKRQGKQALQRKLDSSDRTHYFDHIFLSLTPFPMIQSSNETTFNYIQLSCFEELVNHNGEGPNCPGNKEWRVACLESKELKVGMQYLGFKQGGAWSRPLWAVLGWH